MSIKVTKQQTNIREEITTLRGKTTPEAIIKALSQATDGVGIGTDQPEGTFTVMSHPLNFNPSYPLTQFRALSVGGGDDETSAIIVHANCFKYPTGEGFTDGSSWSSNGAYWATPMIYRSGSSVAGTTGNAQFPFNSWGELILQGSSHGTGYNKGISFVTWNKDHVDENGDPDPYSQSAMQLVMRVSEKGKVGIGTSSPYHKLQIDGDTEYSTIRLESDSKTFDVGVAGSNSSNTTLRGKFYLWDEDEQATRLVIDNAGKVGIGSTTPNQKLTVVNSILPGDTTEQFACGIYAGGSGSNSKGLKIYAGQNAPTAAGGCIYVGFTDGDDTAAGGIRNSSSVSTPEFFSGSDVRMKKNIQDTDIQGVESIKQLKLRKWEWNTDKQTPATDIGLVADELETVFPELVSRTELSGWGHCVGEGEEQLKTIPSESKITLTLIKAVQEQQAIIEQLQSRIDALENK